MAFPRQIAEISTSPVFGLLCSVFYSFCGMQTQSSAGSPQPLQTPSSIAAPHISQGEHPQVWHISHVLIIFIV
jgi:hypothetical protein